MTIKADRQTKGSLITKSQLPRSSSAHSLGSLTLPQLGPLTQHRDIGETCTRSPISLHFGWTPQFFLLPEAWWVLQLSPVAALLPVVGNTWEGRAGQGQRDAQRLFSRGAHGTCSYSEPPLMGPQFSKLAIGNPLRLWFPELSEICIFQSLTWRLIHNRPAPSLWSFKVD